MVYDPENLTKYMNAAVGVTPDRPILIDSYLRKGAIILLVFLLVFSIINITNSVLTILFHIDL